MTIITTLMTIASALMTIISLRMMTSTAMGGPMFGAERFVDFGIYS